MKIIKNLVSGKYSLALTFWGFFVGGSLFFWRLNSLADAWHVTSILPVSMLLDAVLTGMVLSGIIFMLVKDRVTFFRVIALLVVLLQFVAGTILAWLGVSLLWA